FYGVAEVAKPAASLVLAARLPAVERGTVDACRLRRDLADDAGAHVRQDAITQRGRELAGPACHQYSTVSMVPVIGNPASFTRAARHPACPSATTYAVSVMSVAAASARRRAHTPTPAHSAHV